MFRIGQRITCVDDKFVGENRVYDPTFTVRCPKLSIPSLKPALMPSLSDPAHFWTATAIC